MVTPINITDRSVEDQTMPVFRQAFRPLFLLASIFVALSIFTWGAYLAGLINFQPYGGARFWHSHEMLFGFVGAIVVGFLLTAVQNWTGIRAINGKPLLLLVAIWLLARLFMVISVFDNGWLLMTLDISFYIFAAGSMAVQVWRANNIRNMFFVPVLLLIAAFNAMTHLSVIYQDYTLFNLGMRNAIMLITTLMIVITGRVVPMFTANGTKTPRPADYPFLNKGIMIIAWLITLLTFGNIFNRIPSVLSATIFTIAASLLWLRSFIWFRKEVLQVPLVWSLHLAHAFIPLAFTLFALHYADQAVSYSTALHGLTAGAMGTLILAMICRISLGHTGRILAAPKAMNIAFIFITIGALGRLGYGLFPGYQSASVFLSTALIWGLPFILFTFFYARILVTARPDGQTG